MSRILHNHNYWGKSYTKSVCVPEKIQWAKIIHHVWYNWYCWVCKGLTVFDIGEAVSEVEVFS